MTKTIGIRTGTVMTTKKNKQETAKECLKALDDLRVAMVKRHEKPVVIRAVSAAYEKLYAEVHRR